MPEKTEEFFDEPREQSLVKSRIVAKYFWAWAKVIIPFVKTGDRRLLYMDLFAGPGRYNDGTPSTPITVLETAIKEPDLRAMLVTFFNDKDIRERCAPSKRGRRNTRCGNSSVYAAD